MKQAAVAFTALSLMFANLLPLDASAQAPAGLKGPPGVKAQPLFSAPITGVEGKEAVVMALTIAPGAAVPMHTHPGDCVGTVVEGMIELLVTGQKPRRVSAGEGYGNSRGTVHGFKNVGTSPARVMNVLMVDNGKPRLTPQRPPQK